MKYAYVVAVADRSTRTDGTSVPTFNFNFESHDDIHAIVARVGNKELFDENKTKTFVTGLKMLGSVVLTHRNEPLFKEFAGAFGSFMKTLKAVPDVTN